MVFSVNNSKFHDIFHNKMATIFPPVTSCSYFRPISSTSSSRCSSTLSTNKMAINLNGKQSIGSKYMYNNSSTHCGRQNNNETIIRKHKNTQIETKEWIKIVKSDPMVGFSDHEVEIIIAIYMVLIKGHNTKELSSRQLDVFLNTCLGVKETHILNKIPRQYFFVNSRKKCDQKQKDKEYSSKSCSLLVFCRIMWILVGASLKEQAKFVFGIVDRDGDGLLQRRIELKMCMENAFSPIAIGSTEFTTSREDNLSEPIQSTINYLIEKFSKKTMTINESSFIREVMNEPVLLGCLRDCLPDQKSLLAFYNCMFGKLPEDICKLSVPKQRHKSSVYNPNLFNDVSSYASDQV